MRKNFVLSCCAAALFNTVSVSASESLPTLQDATLSVYGSSSSEIDIATTDTLDCRLSAVPKSKENLRYYALRDCGFRLYELAKNRPKLIFYRTAGVYPTDTTRFTAAGGALRDFVYRYLPDWSLRGALASEAVLDPGWKRATPGELSQLLSEKYLIDVQFDTKTITVAEKPKKRNAIDTRLGNLGGAAQTSLDGSVAYNGEQATYALLYPFEDLNRDLFETVKGYFSGAKVVKNTRDGKHYILLDASEKSREPLARTYAYIKASLDDKLVKAQQLDGFFPKEEKLALEVIYYMLSDSVVKSFYPEELEDVSVRILLPRGMKKYAAEIKRRAEAEQFLSAGASFGIPPIPDGLPAPPKSTNQSKVPATVPPPASTVPTPTVQTAPVTPASTR